MRIPYVAVEVGDGCAAAAAFLVAAAESIERAAPIRDTGA